MRRRIARLLPVLAAIAFIAGCAGPTRYFLWPDEPNALAKADVSLGNVVHMRNCAVMDLRKLPREVEAGVVTLRGAGTWACYFTRDRQLIAVGPLDHDVPVRLKLDESLPWYAYVVQVPIHITSAFWLRDVTASSPDADFLFVFRPSSGDADGYATNTIRKYLLDDLKLKAVARPPVRIRVITQIPLLHSYTETILP